MSEFNPLPVFMEALRAGKTIGEAASVAQDHQFEQFDEHVANGKTIGEAASAVGLSLAQGRDYWKTVLADLGPQAV